MSDEGAGKRREPLADTVTRFAKAARSTAKKYGPKGDELARKSADAVKRGVDATRPEVERLVRETKPRAQKMVRQAKPHAERAGREALSFARQHEKEIMQIGGMIVRRAAPRPLSTFLTLIEVERSSEKRPREE